MRHLLAFVFIFNSFHLSANWWDRKCEGWFYYEEPKKEESVEIQETKKSAKDLLENCKEDLEEKLANFILEPSKESAVEYLETQKMWLERSSEVQRHWEMALLENPSLDHSVSFPISHYGLKVSKEIKNRKIKETIKKASTEYSLVFFYRGGERFSQAFAKIINLFSDLHKWEVFGISNDNIFLEELPNSKRDNGLSEKFDVKGYPAVFAVSHDQKRAYPISYGLVSIDQLEKNVLFLFGENGGEF